MTLLSLVLLIAPFPCFFSLLGCSAVALSRSPGIETIVRISRWLLYETPPATQLEVLPSAETLTDTELRL